MALLTFSIIITVFIVVFTHEVIAPASKNRCDRRWMILASAISLFQSITTLALGVIFFELFSKVSLIDSSHLNIYLQAF